MILMIFYFQLSKLLPGNHEGDKQPRGKQPQKLQVLWWMPCLHFKTVGASCIPACRHESRRLREDSNCEETALPMIFPGALSFNKTKLAKHGL
jgi:hypothetical protein